MQMDDTAQVRIEGWVARSIAHASAPSYARATRNPGEVDVQRERHARNISR